MAQAAPIPRSLRPLSLVVDDSKIARHVLARMLEQLGWRVDLADSAETALGRLEARIPDLVFMDHILPGMSGLDAVKHLRAQPRTRDLPIVMYTSQEGAEFAEEAMSLGANAVLVKTKLQSQLAELLDRVARPVEVGGRAGDVARREREPQRRRDLDLPQTHRAAVAAPGTAIAGALSPLLSRHHEALRHDLLAEFAILERYQEGMRRDLIARIDKRLGGSMVRLDRSLEQRLGTLRDDRRRAVHWARAAAGLALIAAVGAISITWRLNESVQHLLQGSAAELTLLEAHNAQLDAVATSLARDRAAPLTARQAQRRSTVADAAPRAAAPADSSPSAAAVLVTELQSMGILGPIRVETESAAFCVSARAGRLELEAGSLSFGHCDRVPLQAAVATY